MDVQRGKLGLCLTELQKMAMYHKKCKVHKHCVIDPGVVFVFFFFLNLINFLCAPFAPCPPKTCHISHLFYAPRGRLPLFGGRERVINVESEGEETEGRTNKHWLQTLALNASTRQHCADLETVSPSMTWRVSRCSNQGKCCSAERGCKPSAGEKVRSKKFEC